MTAPLTNLAPALPAQSITLVMLIALLRRGVCRVTAASATLMLSSCGPAPGADNAQPKLWWHDLSQQQISDTIYKTFCSEEPEQCLPNDQYRVDFYRDRNIMLILVFEGFYNQSRAAISCWSMDHDNNGALSCSGGYQDSPDFERRYFDVHIPTNE